MLGKRPRQEEEPQDPQDPPPSKDLAPKAPPAPAEPAKRLQASLEIIGGPGKGDVIALTRMVTMIGRQEGCDIVLQDQTVSREHGQIEQSMGEWVYTNFSENSTYLNRRKTERAILRNGDTLEVGGETRLRFTLKEPEALEAGPLVRRRPRKSRDEIEAVAEEPVKSPNVVSTISQSFKKRRGLMIGLILYLVVMLVAVIFGKAMFSKDEAPRAALSMAPQDRNQILVALELHYGLPPDKAMANKKLEEAKLQYQRRSSGDPMALFNALRAFTESNEYRGGGMPDYQDQKMFDDVKNTLADDLLRLYNDGLLAEQRGDKRNAREFYNKIMQRLPGENPFYKHVQARQMRL